MKSVPQNIIDDITTSTSFNDHLQARITLFEYIWKEEPFELICGMCLYDMRRKRDEEGGLSMDDIADRNHIDLHLFNHVDLTFANADDVREAF